MKTRTLIDINLTSISNLKEGVDLLNSRIRAVDRSVFNIALLGCYLIGIEIPFHDVTDGTHIDSCTFKYAISGADMHESRKNLIKAVGRNKSTVSKWIRAMQLIIEEGHFHEFANGTRKFRVEDLARIESYREQLIVNGNYKLSDLLDMDTKELNSIINSIRDKKGNSKEDKPTTKTEEDTVLDSKVFKWEHDGIMYEIPIEDMIKFAEPYKVELKKEEEVA